VALLPDSPGIQVPHMGWNTIPDGKTVPLLDGSPRTPASISCTATPVP